MSFRLSSKSAFGLSGPLVLALVFIVALVLAANHQTVLGWFIAVVAFGWLVLATAISIGVAKAAAFGATQVAKMTGALENSPGGGVSAGGGAPIIVGSAPEGRPPTAETGSLSTQDRLKLEHNFTIIQVQARVIDEQLERYARQIEGSHPDSDPSQGRELIARALATIRMTADAGKATLTPGDCR